jgi:Domain of unknown function (DUF4410)
MFAFHQIRSHTVAAVMAVGLLSVAGCSRHVTTTGNYVAPVAQTGAQMPPPSRVLVYDFTIDPKGLQLDSGMRARLTAMMQAGGDPAAKRAQMAADVDSAISETLVTSINGMGLNAVAAMPGIPPSPGDIIVQGQVVRIDAGNQTRRTIIGLGAGKSQVYANVQVLQAMPGGNERLLQTYDANANSGRAPGLVVGAGSAAAGNYAIAAVGTVASTVARSRTGLGKDAENMAKKVASNLRTFFVGQGWVAPSGS